MHSFLNTKSTVGKNKRIAQVKKAQVFHRLLQVYVSGYDVRSSLSSAFQAMGYCPQYDPLWEKLTLEEHIEVYAAVRGIPQEHIPKIVT